MLVRLSHLGDVVHAVPVYRALREAYPKARIAWAVQPEFAGLVRELPGLDRALLFERGRGLRGWWRLFRALRHFRADWAVDAQGNTKSAAVTCLSGARKRSGMHPTDCREGFASRFLNDWAPRLAKDSPSHAVDRNLHLARHLIAGAQLGPFEPEVGFPIHFKSLDRGRARYSELLGSARGALIVQLAAPGDVRAWPAEHQLAFLRQLSRTGRPCVVLSGPGEADFGHQMRRQLADCDGLQHWVGQRGLEELTGFLGAAAEAQAHFLGCDSGPLHLAIACGLSATCLAGPQDASQTGPWPTGDESHHRVLRAPEELYCAPCFSRTCARPEGRLCMHGILPAQVLASLQTPTTLRADR